MKKAQVTAYVIMGVIAIAVVILSYAFRDTLFSSQWEQEQKASLAVPEQAKKVKLFTESCIQETLKDGIALLSSQGGYLTIPQDPLPRSSVNPLSNALYLFDNSQARIPYWFYETANGVPQQQIPSKQDMESQLKVYLQTNLPDCLREYETFTKQGYIISRGEIIPAITITDDSVRTTLRLPLSITLNEFSFNLDRFYVSIDHSLGRMYNQARTVMQLEDKDNFLENYALDVMRVYDEIPFSGIDMECTPRTWKRTDIITAIKKALAANIPLIKMEGSDFALSQQSNKYFIVPSPVTYTELTTQFLYSPDWPILIDILDEGPIIQGKPFTLNNALSKFLAPFFCLNDYHTIYDIKFPVLITIRDKADNLFQFATVVSIDNNQPRENTLSIPTYDTSSPICAHPVTPLTITTQAKLPDGSLTALPGVTLSLKCLTATCHIGTTGSDGSLLAQVPQCTNALLTAEKHSFHRAENTLSTVQPATTSLMLEPLYTLEPEVKVIDNNNIRPLQPTEKALFVFEEKEKQYTTTLVAPEQKTLTLLAGEYSIQSDLFVSSDPPIAIGKQEFTTCTELPQQGVLGVLGFKEKSCTTHTIDAFSLPEVSAGGASFIWSLSQQELASAKKITLYIVRSSTPKKLEDLATIDETKAENAKKTKQPDLE